MRTRHRLDPLRRNVWRSLDWNGTKGTSKEEGRPAEREGWRSTEKAGGGGAGGKKGPWPMIRISLQPDPRKAQPPSHPPTPHHESVRARARARKPPPPPPPPHPSNRPPVAASSSSIADSSARLASAPPFGFGFSSAVPSPLRHRLTPTLCCHPTTGSSKKHELKSKQKLEKKLSFYTKVKDAVTSLNAKKTISKKQSSRQKKLKAYDLSALSEFLPEPAAAEQKTEAKLNCKSRQTLVQREAAQLKAVLNNPQFQLDPFAAIHQHLIATQPPAKKDDATKQDKDSKDKKRRRKKKKKASSSAQSMEI
ncbi:hypothetical protein ACP4OV_003453 [Aristida adscensionis]